MPISETKSKIEISGNGKTQEETSVAPHSQRLDVRKTYKLYIDGKFPRSESGRYLKVNDANGKLIANTCRASRKDFRDAVVAARKAQEGWAKKSAYSRGQILYRIAETLEGRKIQFIENIKRNGIAEAEALKEFQLSVDRLIYYAGWTDKYQQVFSSVNPAEGSYFNFSYPEPTGVVSVVATENLSLLSLISVIAPVIAGGNSCIALVHPQNATTAIDFAEAIHASDVPGGVVNLLTGLKDELIPHFSSHMDVNAIVYCGKDAEEIKTIQTNAALNVKRALLWNQYDWLDSSTQNPYLIMDLQEIKTTWHPVGI